MSKDINALLIFCEGPHDTAILRTIFRKILNYNIVSDKFSEMPYPLDFLFKRMVSKHNYDDLSLDMVHKFHLPSEILRNENNIVLLFESTGKNQYAPVKNLLTDYISLFLENDVFSASAKEIIKNSKYLFIFDADEDGIEYYNALLKREYTKFSNIDFLNTELSSFFSAHGRFNQDKALYIWSSTLDKGTLEDILVPIMEYKDATRLLKEKVKEALKNIFNWEISESDRVKNRAEYHKALLTVSGQKERPGKSLNVILKDRVLFDTEDLKKSPLIQEFIKFLKAFYEGL
ncbi:MAG: hypothetical protein LBG80_18035 [Bacteroidales bacterium]|jgi:hypothetical protein|nr:hypothetical protein [Bacteroidales bacterium]